MNRLIKLLIIVLFILVSVGCGMKPTAREAAIEYLELYRNKDKVVMEELHEYVNEEDLTDDQKEKYYDVCEKITDNTGLCPVFAGVFPDNDVKINADKNIMTISRDKEVISISSGSDFVVPSIYEKLLPSNVSRYDFFSALYELCGVFSLGEGIFNTLLVNNEKKHVNDIHFT